MMLLYIAGGIVAYAIMGGVTVGFINAIEDVDPKEDSEITGMVIGGAFWPAFLFVALPAVGSYRGMIRFGKWIRKRAKEKEKTKEKKRIAEEKMRIELEEIENSIEEELKSKQAK